MKAGLVCALAGGALLSCNLACADEIEAEKSARRKRMLDAAGPPHLPNLSHAEPNLNFEYTVAVAEPTDVASAEEIEGRQAFMYAGRATLEWPLVPRKWFVGGSFGVASAAVPSGEDPTTGGAALLFANPEVWGRGVWFNEVGLSAGGGVSFVVPVPRTFSSLEAEVVRAVRTIRPHDYPQYEDLSLTARPFFDIRHVTGPVVLQVRQGIDFELVARARNENENRYDLAAWLSVYAGVTTIEQLVVGLELAEVYQITADTTVPNCLDPCDTNRVQFTLSPSLRLRLPVLSPALSALIPLSTPLRNEVSNYFGMRLHLDVLF
ncbi:MAG: hypothetical protein AAGA56_29105 [Myxococcota bacterium]